MTEYSELRLIHPILERHVSEGHYRVMPDPVTNLPDTIQLNSLFVDRKTGEIHGKHSHSSTDLIDVMGYPEIATALDNDPITLAFRLSDSADHGMLKVAFSEDCPVSHDDIRYILENLERSDVVRFLLKALTYLGKENEKMLVPENISLNGITIRSLFDSVTIIESAPIEIGASYEIDYTNYRGERGKRTITVVGFDFGSNPWHTQSGIMLRGLDVARGVERTFTTDTNSRIHSLVKVP